MALPFDPPIEPMLAKLSDDASRPATAGSSSPSGTAFGRSSSATATRSYIQSRDLKPLDRYFPELRRAAARQRFPSAASSTARS